MDRGCTYGGGHTDHLAHQLCGFSIGNRGLVFQLSRTPGRYQCLYAVTGTEIKMVWRSRMEDWQMHADALSKYDGNSQ